MTSDQLKRRTKRFALAIIDVVDKLPNTSSTRAIGSQLVRSGTAIGANYRAACRGRSKAEFIAKIGIVEEADETEYWLELLLESGKVSAEVIHPLLEEAGQLTAIFAATAKTARLNRS